MPLEDHTSAPLDESDVEWERLCRFVGAAEAPLALIEIESSFQAEQTISALERKCPDTRARVFRVTTETDSGAPIRWLSEQQADANVHTLFLVLMTEDRPGNDDGSRAFWTWASSQRERWRPAAGKLAFVLTPPHVNDLARHADALWDWIPLKFNLLRPRGAGAAQERSQMADSRPLSGNPGLAAQRLPALREQLLHARERGLAESIIRREYAWPLFKALSDANRFREAEVLCRNELAGDFAGELSVEERFEWLLTLGYLHLDLWQLSDAEQAFRKLHEHAGRQRSDSALAIAMFGIGRVKQEARQLDEAEQWYRKSLAIDEKQGSEHGAAITYHQLGIIAEKQRDFAAAEQWYRKSLAIFEKLGIEQHAASTYHQLGMIAEKQRDFAAAEQWYRKSLAIKEKQGDKHGAASTYHQLGILAQEQRDFAAAEQWYRKSLAIDEKQGDEHGAAMTYGQLGILAGLREQFEEAGRWLIKSVLAFTRWNDRHEAERNAGNFMVCYERAPTSVREKLAAMWGEAGLGDLPASGPESPNDAKEG